MAIVVENKKTKKRKSKEQNGEIKPSSWSYYDKITIFAILFLLVLSVIFVFSTTIHYSIFQSGSSPLSLIIKHVIIIVIGVLGYIVASRVPTSFYKKYWLPISFFVIALMVVPLFFAGRNGAKRWIDLGLFDLQPSEIAKLDIILIWSVAIALKMEDFKQRWTILRKKHASPQRLFKRFWRSWKMPIMLTLALLVLYRLQSDNGSLVISCGLIFLLFFTSGSLPEKSKYIFWGFLAFALVLVGGIYLYLSSFSTAKLVELVDPNGENYSYIFDRFVAWVNPFADYEGAGYQLTNSLIAISEGGLFGKGIGNGLQKQGFLVEGYNDFIIANIIEEIGVLGFTGILILYIVIITRGLKTARESTNTFDTLVATGITSLFFFQTFWNVSGVVGLIPMKGLTAPLLSYGGSSMIITLASLGILQRINIQNKKKQTKMNRGVSTSEQQIQKSSRNTLENKTV